MSNGNAVLHVSFEGEDPVFHRDGGCRPAEGCSQPGVKNRDPGLDYENERE